MSLRLRGRTALVTGAGSGIGAATAVRLAREGAAVAVTDLSLDAAQRTAAAIAAEGGRAEAIALDIGEDTAIMAAVDRVIAALGVPTLLVNNAAATHLSGTGRDRDLLETEVGVWDESYRVNLRGTMLVTKTLLPHLLAVGDGHIVNLSSGSAAKAEPTRFAYSASKAGVESLTRNVAAFYGPRGIRCNAVAPGLVLTEAASAPGRSLDRFRSVFARHTPSALGTPEELAAVIAFLLSDDSRYINGVVLSVDGGLLAGQPYLADLLKR